MGPKMPTALVCYMKEKQPDGDVSSTIRNSLSASLNNGTHNGLSSISSDSANLQNQLAATSKLALMSQIDYEEVNNFNNSVQDLKSKYIVLKPQTSSSSSSSTTTTTTSATVTTTAAAPTLGCNSSATITSNCSNINGKFLTNGVATDKPNNGTASERKGAELPTPRQILYPREKVRIGWKNSERKWIPGAGMINVGNTCYLNSTLQALFHVPAFANWLISDSVHRETCEEKTGIQGGCIICAMAKTLISSQQSGQQAIKPYLVYTKLRLVCKHMVFGQQEDAHEFLRYLMEAMEKAYLLRIPKSSQLDQYSKETTPINQILGGYLKTSVRCLACHHESVTFQHFEDLLLDIRKANTLEEALDLYFARERLEDMGYKCESCKKKVSATKQFSLERAPISLCIQLKRFSIVGNKLNKHIAIRQQLNLSKYSSRKSTLQEPLQYRLVSMVTHLGASQHCGHYTAIGLTDTGSYYQFDDSYVRQISIQNVLNTNAYIIFYELDTSASASATTTATVTAMKATDKLFSSDRISTTTDDQMSRSYSNTKELPRNNVTTTVTSGSSTPKPFIGPLLPSKLNANDSNDSSSASLYNDTGKDSTLSSKSIHSPKKSEHSPIVKLTSNGARYVTQNSNETNTDSSVNKFVQNNGYLPLVNSNNKCASSSSSDDDRNDCDGDSDGDEDDDEDNDDDDDGDEDEDEEDDVSASASAANGRHKYKSDKSDFKRLHSNKEQTLPSMPKLEINDVTNHSEKNFGSNSLKARSLVNGSIKTHNGTNGKIARTTHDESDSDWSCDERARVKRITSTNANTKNAIQKTSNSTAVLLLNGNNKMTTNRLVPYDDSEYDSGTESPPEVKTKAGPFTVTSTNTSTPPVVASFIRNSIQERVHAKTPSPARTVNGNALSNGAKLLESRRESDSNMVVKTAASSVNSNKRPNEWHGNEAKHKLLKTGNHRGYGGVVTSWNGQKSAMEKEVNDEKNQELKRQSLSANDADMDRGHKRKLGSKLVLSRDNPGYNPFQEFQNQRNTWTISNGNGNNSNTSHRSYKPQIYRQNPKQQKFHKHNRNNGSGGRHFGNSYRHNNYNRQMNK